MYQYIYRLRLVFPIGIPYWYFLLVFLRQFLTETRHNIFSDDTLDVSRKAHGSEAWMDRTGMHRQGPMIGLNEAHRPRMLCKGIPCPKGGTTGE